MLDDALAGPQARRPDAAEESRLLVRRDDVDRARRRRQRRDVQPGRHAGAPAADRAAPGRDRQRDHGGTRSPDSRRPPPSALSYPDYEEVRDRNRSFSSLAGFRLIVASFAPRTDQPAQRTFGMAVSGNLFDMLGVQPVLGRAIGVNDDRVVGRDPSRRPRSRPVAAAVRRRSRRRRPRDSCRRRRHDRRRRHAAGLHRARSVRPPGASTSRSRSCRSLKTVGTTLDLTSREVRNIAVKGRLKPGVTVEQAAEDVALIGANLQRAYPDTNRNYGLTAQTEFDARVSARPALAGRRGHAADAVDDRPARRERQPRRPAGQPRTGSRPRDGAAPRDWCRTRAAHTPARRREPAARGRRRRVSAC